MYKIYINETPLILIHSKKLGKIDQRHSNELIVAYPGKAKFLLNYIDMMEKTVKFDRVIIHHTDLKLLKADFLSLFKVVEASGGIVFNKKGQLLVIFRKGHWDLPKGKIHVGEKRKTAAIREIMEETGVKTVKIKKKIGTTYHTFKTITKARNVKKTYWYLMSTPDQKLTPQLEEQIEKAEWIDIQEMLQGNLKTYKNIIEILNKYIDQAGEVAPSS